VLATVALPAYAAPSAPAPAAPGGRFRHLDVATLGRIQNLPAALRGDKTVSALVQLDGEAVAVQQDKAQQGFDKPAAVRRVVRSQDAAVPKLEAAGARPYGRLRTVLNAIQIRVKVADLDEVAAVPGVKTVQVSRLVRPDNGAAERYTGVDQTWQDLGLTGRGQTIGIIDTGIDYTHADFGGPGTAKAFRANNGRVVERGSFPTAKVTGGYDFVGDHYDPGSGDESALVPRPDRDPLDCEGHGSHVAGTAAGQGVTSGHRPYRGPYSKATLSKRFAVQPGVAPQAKLRAYRVFGCTGSADNDVVVAAIDRAAADGVDVINLSLGSSFGTAKDLETQAVEAATRAGVLVVVSAGNSGAAPYLVGTPATSDSALAVAAVDAGAPKLPAASVSGAVRGTAVVANAVRLASPVTGQLVDVGLGCTATDYAHLAGKIALTSRGGCDRADRAVLAARAGARAVIMVNNEAGLPPLEGAIPGVRIPFLGVTEASGPSYRAADGKTVKITARSAIVNSGYRRVAAFSSNGPRRLDSAQKPDVAAPGVAISSVAVGTGSGATRMSGTSMASPHTAGVAALVRQSHPKWAPLQAKAAIMSTASPAKITGFDSQRVGSGLVQPRLAGATQAYLSTKTGLNSLRFGARQLSGAFRQNQTFQVTNSSAKSVTYGFSTRIRPASRLGASVSVTPKTLLVPARSVRTVSVRISFTRAGVARLPGATASKGRQLPALRGLVVAKPSRVRAETPTLRIALLSLPVPLSDVRAAARVRPTGRGANRTGSIAVHNAGVHAGTAELYDWLLTDRAGDAGPDDVADLTDLGVQSLPGTVVGATATDRLLVFAAAEAAGTSTQATREVDLYLDTDRNGVDDHVILVTDTGALLNGEPDGTVTAFTFDLATRELVDAWDAVAPAGGSTVQFPVLTSRIKVTSRSGAVVVRAVSVDAFSGADGDTMPGRATFDPYLPVVSQGNRVMLRAGDRATLPVRVNTGQLSKQTHRGWLVVTADDGAGRAEADRVTLTLAAASPNLAQQTRAGG
jgi:subtilisin family serine protease